MNADERRWERTLFVSYLGSSAFICGFMLIALNGCERKKSETTAAAGPAKVVLQLNWKAEPQFGGFYAINVVESDLKHDLDVEVKQGGVGTPTVQMVAAGQVPFAVVSADELVVSRSKGGDVVALFAVFQTNPQGLMTHASRGLKSIDEIFKSPGIVAMQRGLPYATFLEKKFGFGVVKIVPSPGGDLSAFRNDSIYTMQCFVTSEPLAAKKAGLDPQTFLVADAGYNPYTCVMVTRGDFLRSNRKTVDSMVAAVREGWEAYLGDSRPGNAAMHKVNPTMDAETFAAGAEAQRPLIETVETATLGIGAMTGGRWQTLCDQLWEMKPALEKPVAGKDCFVWTPAPAETTQATTQP